MEITYHNQIPAKNFKFLDRINIVYSKNNGKPYIQIYPFRILFNDTEYKFNGINSGNWIPNVNTAIIGEIDEDNKFQLIAIAQDMLNFALNKHAKTLGIFIYIKVQEISILNHIEELP